MSTSDFKIKERDFLFKVKRKKQWSIAPSNFICSRNEKLNLLNRLRIRKDTEKLLKGYFAKIRRHQQQIEKAHKAHNKRVDDSLNHLGKIRTKFTYKQRLLDFFIQSTLQYVDV